MASLNQCSFIGNVGKDPEIKTFNDGGKIANFSIACSEKWKDRTSGEAKERTEWINVSVKSDGLVGVVERFVKKGSKLFIQGKLQTRSWEKDGEKRYATEVVLTGFDGTLVMLDGPKQDGGGYEPRQQAPTGRVEGNGGTSRQHQPAGFDSDLDDDVPFVSMMGAW